MCFSAFSLSYFFFFFFFFFLLFFFLFFFFFLLLLFLFFIIVIIFFFNFYLGGQESHVLGRIKTLLFDPDFRSSTPDGTPEPGAQVRRLCLQGLEMQRKVAWPAIVPTRWCNILGQYF